GSGDDIISWRQRPGLSFWMQGPRSWSRWGTAASWSVQSRNLFQSARKSVALPLTPEDNQIRDEVLEIIFCCLFKLQGAYATSRLSALEDALPRLIKDLKKVRDRLYFLHTPPRIRRGGNRPPSLR